MMMCNNFVAGQFVAGKGAAQKVISPSTGKPIGEFHHSTPGDLDAAVEIAKKAFNQWQKTPMKERAGLLLQLRAILLRDIETISKQVSLESGKTIAEARAGIMKGVEVLEFASALQNSDQGGRMQVSRGVFCEYRREPLGV